MDVDDNRNFSNSNNDFNNVLMQQDNNNDISVIIGKPEHVQSGIRVISKLWVILCHSAIMSIIMH